MIDAPLVQEALTGDFRALLADLGNTPIGLPLPAPVTLEDGTEQTTALVACLARRLGVRRADSDAQAHSNERGEQARAYLLLEDLGLNGLDVPKRGQTAELWGLPWQVREAEILGLDTGQVLRLTLARLSQSRGR